jgi:hypothetical protein
MTQTVKQNAVANKKAVAKKNVAPRMVKPQTEIINGVEVPVLKLADGEVLMLRTCDKNGRAYGGFQWPQSGEVTAPDWSARANCGNGLHGLLWGEGDAGHLSSDVDAVWMIVGVKADTPRVDLNGKWKAKTCAVHYYGLREVAVGLLQKHAPAGSRIAYGTATAGDDGTATAGYCGTATAGDGGTATAGYGGTATAGVRGTATAGDRGTATAGVRGTATAGDGGTATAGYGGTATAGVRGTATAGYGGTATAGEEGCITFLWWDQKRSKYRRAAFEIGEDGVEANVAYRCEGGKLVKA